MISVIVPIFNIEDYLDDCLKSIVNQTYRDIEVLCIDDCTLDNSVNIVKKYMQTDSRVRLINHDVNRGLGGARNTGIREARGEYIAFVDSDDWIKKDMLEKLLRGITEHDVDVAICGVELYYGAGMESVVQSTFHYIHRLPSKVYNIADYKERLTDVWPSAWNKLYKTDLVRKYGCNFPEKLLYEDHFFFYNYFAHVKAFYYVDEAMYVYRQNRPGSITTTRSGREKEVFKVLEDLRTVFQSCFDKDRFEKTYAKICFRLIWERQFIFRSCMKEWLIFAEESSAWLLGRFDREFLRMSVDTLVPAKDMFYRYMFGTGTKKLEVELRYALMKSRVLRKVYHMICRLREILGK